MFREFVIAQRKQRDEFQRASLIGYQAVAIWIATQNKKGRMPSFESLVGAQKAVQSVQQLKSALELMSVQTGIPLQKAKKRRVH